MPILVILEVSFDRIVSLCQAQSRPMVRGKARCNPCPACRSGRMLQGISRGGPFGLPLCAQADRGFVSTFAAHGARAGDRQRGVSDALVPVPKGVVLDEREAERSSFGDQPGVEISTRKALPRKCQGGLQ